jgi:hypothetical protein
MAAELFNVVVGLLAMVAALSALICIPAWLIRKHGARIRTWYLKGFACSCSQCSKMFFRAPNVCPECQIAIAIKAAREKARQDGILKGANGAVIKHEPGAQPTGYRVTPVTQLHTNL